MTDRRSEPVQPQHRPTSGGLSALVLLALTVQLSISMLEWVGPASVETRARLATTIVAAAHRGVFTEPDRPQGGVACKAVRSRVQAFGSPRGVTSQACGNVSMAVSPWSTCLPPPLA